MHQDRETNWKAEKQADSNIYDLVYRTQDQVCFAIQSRQSQIEIPHRKGGKETSNSNNSWKIKRFIFRTFWSWLQAKVVLSAEQGCWIDLHIPLPPGRWHLAWLLIGHSLHKLVYDWLSQDPHTSAYSLVSRALARPHTQDTHRHHHSIAKSTNDEYWLRFNKPENFPLTYLQILHTSLIIINSNISLT